MCPSCQADCSEACRLNVAVIGEEVGAPGESLQGISEIVREVRVQNGRMLELLRAVSNAEFDAHTRVLAFLREREMLARFAAIDRMYR